MQTITYAQKLNIYILYWYFQQSQCLNLKTRGLQLIFRMHNSDPTPQGVENRNILLWFKCVLTALHVNCMILFDKVL
jgi:hypothetical protein